MNIEDVKILLDIKSSLTESLESMDAEEMNDASWGYEEGVLITGNQAKAIIVIIDKTLDNK